MIFNYDVSDLKGAIDSVQGYKSGDSVSTIIRNVGRITSDGAHIYTAIILDKPVLVNYANVSVTVSGTQNIIPIGNSAMTGGVSTSTVTAISVANNIVTVSLPTINSGLTNNSVYYLELGVTITFN